MELLYMGTAAAEGLPSIFCDCEVCQRALKTGGHELRTRSAALVDGVLKLDFGPDTLSQCMKNGICLSKIHSVLITHSHDDHYSLVDIWHRTPGAAYLKDNSVMTIYGNGKVGSMFENLKKTPLLAFKQLKVFETVLIEGYAVTPLEGVHTITDNGAYPVVFEGKTVYREEEVFIYLIEKDGKKLLYGHDTDELTPADMDFLKGRHLDLISLDCTTASKTPDYIGHMGSGDNLRMREKLIANGAADEHTIFVASHLSHNGYLPEAELQKLMPGFIIAYDGLKIEF